MKQSRSPAVASGRSRNLRLFFKRRRAELLHHGRNSASCASSPADTQTLPAVAVRTPRHQESTGSGWSYFAGGGGVKISRLRPGSGFGFGLGAFLVSFFPLSLFPMHASMTQLPACEKSRLMPLRIGCPRLGAFLFLRLQRFLGCYIPKPMLFSRLRPSGSRRLGSISNRTHLPRNRSSLGTCMAYANVYQPP
jgi:hypothetical protein